MGGRLPVPDARTLDADRSLTRIAVAIDRDGARSSLWGGLQLDALDGLARDDGHDPAGPFRRLPGLEPERGHLDEVLARPDELQREGPVGPGLGGRVVVAVLIEGCRLGPDLSP